MRQSTRACRTVLVCHTVAHRVSQHNADLVTVGGKGRAELLAARRAVGERVGLVGQAAGYGFIELVVAYEAEGGRALAVVESHFRHHAHPVAVLASSVTGGEREVAEAIIDRPALVDLDR